MVLFVRVDKRIYLKTYLYASKQHQSVSFSRVCQVWMDVRESLACQVPRYSKIWLSSFKHGHVKRVTVVIMAFFKNLLQGAAGKPGSPGEVGLQGLPVSLTVVKKKSIRYMNCHDDCEEGQKCLPENKKVQIC